MVSITQDEHNRSYVVDPNLGLGRRLHEDAVVELPGQIESLVLPHHTLLFQVTLVPHEHHGHVVSVLQRQKEQRCRPVLDGQTQGTKDLDS